MELGTKKYINKYGFCHLQEIFVAKMEKQLLDTATKTELDALKPVSKKMAIKQLRK